MYVYKMHLKDKYIYELSYMIADQSGRAQTGMASDIELV